MDRRGLSRTMTGYWFGNHVLVGHIVVSAQKGVNGVRGSSPVTAVGEGVQIRLIVVDGLAGVEDGIVI